MSDFGYSLLWLVPEGDTLLWIMGILAGGVVCELLVSCCLLSVHPLWLEGCTYRSRLFPNIVLVFRFPHGTRPCIARPMGSCRSADYGEGSAVPLKR